MGSVAVKLLYFPGFMGSDRDIRLLSLEATGLSRIDFQVANPQAHLQGRRSRSEVLSAWADELQGQRFDLLLGYSMGARMASEILQLVPDLSPRGLLLSPHPGLVSDVERQARSQQDRSWAMRFRAATTQRAWRRLARDWNSQPVLRSRRPQFGRWQERSRYARELELLGLATQPDQRAWYRQAPGIRVLIGERDEKFCELWRDLPHEIVPGSGHRLLVDAPEIVRSFVAASY